MTDKVVAKCVRLPVLFDGVQRWMEVMVEPQVEMAEGATVEVLDVHLGDLDGFKRCTHCGHQVYTSSLWADHDDCHADHVEKLEDEKVELTRKLPKDKRHL